MPFKFQAGQVVQHRRYGYRGAILDGDEACRADDDWYQNNQTQPRRDQPWYHVLVDGAEHMRYVAEENLEIDATGKPIRHPLIPRYFRGFLHGCYSRESLN